MRICTFLAIATTVGPGIFAARAPAAGPTPHPAGDTIDFTRGDKPGPAVDWNLGATGARGWIQGENEETFHARQILITRVDEGSPAAGILQVGDVILGVEGRRFESDARRALGKALTRAETERGGGRLRVLRWRRGGTGEVVIRIPIMGSYGKTTPWNCEKSRRILDQACAYLLKRGLGPDKDGYGHDMHGP